MTEPNRDISGELTELEAQLAAAGVLIVRSELLGPALRAEIDDAAELVAIAAHTGRAVLYLHEERLSLDDLTEREARVHAAQRAAQAATEEEGQDEDDDAPWLAEVSAALATAAHVAAQQLKAARAHLDELGAADLALVAGGVVHQSRLRAPWRAALDDAFDDLADAMDTINDPRAGVSDDVQEARWAEQAARRRQEEELRAAAVRTAGEALAAKLTGDLNWQALKAEDKRWRHALAVASVDLGLGELQQHEKTQLRPFVDRAWSRVNDQIVPAARRTAVERLTTSPQTLTAGPAWQAATTRASRQRLIRTYLVEQHPLLATPDLVDEVSALLQTPPSGAEPATLPLG